MQEDPQSKEIANKTQAENCAQILIATYTEYQQFQNGFTLVESNKQFNSESLKPPWDKIAKKVNQDKQTVATLIDMCSDDPTTGLAVTIYRAKNKLEKKYIPQGKVEAFQRGPCLIIIVDRTIDYLKASYISDEADSWDYGGNFDLRASFRIGDSYGIAIADVPTIMILRDDDETKTDKRLQHEITHYRVKRYMHEVSFGKTNSQFSALLRANKAIQKYEKDTIGQQELQTALQVYTNQIMVKYLEEMAVEMISTQRRDLRPPYTEDYFSKIMYETNSKAEPLVQQAQHDFIQTATQIQKNIWKLIYSFQRIEEDQQIVYNTIGMLLITITADEIPSLSFFIDFITDIELSQTFHDLKQDIEWIIQGYIPFSIRQEIEQRIDTLKAELRRLASVNQAHQHYGYKSFREQGDDFPTALQKTTDRLVAFREGAQKLQQEIDAINSLIQSELESKQSNN